VSTIVIESLNQLRDLNEVCKKLSRYQDVLLRIQLDYEKRDKSVLGGQQITPFGLGVEDWKSISLNDFPNVRIKGIHCFQWGNILDLSYLEDVWTETIEASLKLSHQMCFELQILDLGGGLGISYTDDQELSFQDVHALLLRLKNRYQLNRIWLELGRFSIGKFGSYFTRIVDVKTVRGKNLIVTEGGINHLARPALVGESFPCEAFETEGKLKQFSVHGPLCTALDKLGDFDLPETLRPGDWLRFSKAGAYGFSESMPYFLCHGLAGEAFRHKGQLWVPRAPKSYLEWPV
jgi:diaminopimelate decarboxylase